MKNFTKLIRERIAGFLFDATSVVIHSYERYLGNELEYINADKKKEKEKEKEKQAEGADQEPSAARRNDPVSTPETFKKFHDAGKSAASHLESLLKLANATDDSEGDRREADQKDLERRLQLAQKEIDMRGGSDE